jgi:hypothetical protein
MPPTPTGSAKSKLTVSKIALYAVAAIAIFLILRFVFSVAMSILKFVMLGALALFVVWLFIAKDGGDKSGKSG